MKRASIDRAPLLAAAIIAACALALPVRAKDTQAAVRSVTIKRDNWGTPHIYAGSVYGLYYGYGYAVAQDRLFQMEMARRTFTGRVAEVLGEKHVAFDRSIRANYTPASLQRQFDALGRSERAIFEGYAAGFNAWLREVRKDRGRLLPKQSSTSASTPRTGRRWTW
jgi:penicillin amidase